MKLKAHSDSFTIVSIEVSEMEIAKAITDNLDPFSSITFDTNEISLVIKKDTWNELKGKFKIYKEEGPYRLITFDLILDLSLVGFMAVISKRLAQTGVSIYALSTFLRDHILVKEEDFELSIRVLQNLIEESMDR